jgi:CTP:molybdopterin cytidylyltransferase MocA
VTTYGVVLAAGAGSRMGAPKALKHDVDGTSWLRRAIEVVRSGGCDEVYLVLGAAVEEALPLLDGAGVEVVIAHDWAAGMSASVIAGLQALRDSPADAALLMLVDLPDVTADVVRRLVSGIGPHTLRHTLRRAAYAGQPGHPALIGRDHWAGVLASAVGDQGARAYFEATPHELIECGDLAGGQDVDADPTLRQPGRS